MTECSLEPSVKEINAAVEAFDEEASQRSMHMTYQSYMSRDTAQKACHAVFKAMLWAAARVRAEEQRDGAKVVGEGG